MDTDNNKHNQPVTDYEEVGGRPRISKYRDAPKFEVGDQVWLINQFGDRDGPYVVSSLPEAGQCTLCELDWQTPVRNNELVSLDYLEKAA